MLNVILLGLVSFFSDISAEMVYPLIPLYLTSVFSATPALVGVIEGIAESLASLLKVFSGYVTDKYKKKKLIAFIGYTTGLIYKVALIVAGSWVGILGARVIDRIGKGIRTTPRDVMVSESAKDGCAGQAFGIHKALDMAGSAIGILISYLLLQQMSSDFNYRNYKKIFLISVIPVLLGLLMFFFIKEKRSPYCRTTRAILEKCEKVGLSVEVLPSNLFSFTLGNSSNVFLLLRAKSVGFDDTSVILLYFIYSLTASLLSIPAGKRSDKVGRKRLLVAGYTIFHLFMQVLHLLEIS